MYLIRGFCLFFLTRMTLAVHMQEESLEDTDVRIRNEDSSAIVTLPLYDSSRWIPRFQISEDEEQPSKRRRIRKRKRRPPVFEEEAVTRKMLPQRLDKIKEPWEIMSDEISQKSNNRRRLTPIYGLSDKSNENKQYEKVRDPFTALQEADEKQKKKINDSNHDLKAILKQSGGLSLSELLQQENLTLAELLQGNQQAIRALVREAESTTQSTPTTDGVKYRRLPPSVALKKDGNANDARQSSESLSSQEILEAQRKRLALLHSHRETGKFPDIVKINVTTEESTKKNISVPNNFSVDNHIEIKNRKTSTDLTNSTATASAIFTKDRTAKLPITNAKINKLTTHSQEKVTKIPEKAVAISLTEIFGFNVTADKSTTPTDGPLKMVIELVEATTTQTDLENFIQTVVSVKVPSDENTTRPTSVKLKNVTAAEEIMEILKNPQEKENLFKILKRRNMTVEELVQQRERGSSQLHLADIFHNKTREPEPKDEPFIGHIESNDFYNFIFSNRTAKAIKTFPKTSTEKEISTTTKVPYTITSFPTYKIETNKDNNPPPFLPIWQQLYPNFFEDDYDNSNIQQSRIVRPTTTSTEHIDLQDLEDIENALAEAANDQLKVESTENIYDDEDFINLPSGVKSAILASLAIIGLSLLVFLTILFIFKWTQKQRRRNYSGSVSGSKIMSPILELNQRRNFRNFVSETLGKKKNYYKAHLQSMSDSIWDKDDRKSYMI